MTKDMKFKALLHEAISLATCLAILLRHKLHEILPSVTYPATDICRNFFVAAIVAKSSQGAVTLGNFSCNLSRNFVATQVARCDTGCVNRVTLGNASCNLSRNLSRDGHKQRRGLAL